MGTPYEKIYENLLPKFKDYDIPLMTVEEVEETIQDFFIPAIARFHTCYKDLSKMDAENKMFEVELNAMEIEILTNFILLEYLDSTYIRVPSLLKVHYSSKDFNAFSNANHLDKLIDMHKTLLVDNETLLARYSWMIPDDVKIDIGSRPIKKTSS